MFDDLTTAWSAWLSGIPVRGTILGVSVLWWGRIGKLLQFFSAATIIADIVGPERLRRFGASLHRTNLVRRSWVSLKSMVRWSYLMLRAGVTKGADQDIALDGAFKINRYVSALNILLALYMGYLTMNAVASAWALHGKIFAFLVGMYLFMVAVGPLLITAALIAAALLGLLVDTALLRPAAFLLEHERVEQIIKIGAVLC